MNKCGYSSMVEQGTHNPLVIGSNPIIRTMKPTDEVKIVILASDHTAKCPTCGISKKMGFQEILMSQSVFDKIVKATKCDFCNQGFIVMIGFM